MQRDFKGIWIPKEICCQNDLNITEEIVLSVVSTLSEQDDGCFANNEYFAQLLNLLIVELLIVNSFCPPIYRPPPILLAVLLSIVA